MSDHTTTADPPPIPFCEVVAHFRARRAGATKIFAGILGASLIVAALLPPQFSAKATLAVLPAPEFTVRPDAGSHALSTSAFAMDQVMEAESEILQSSDLQEATLHKIGMLNLYPDIDPSTASLPVRVLRTLIHALLSPWVTTVADSPERRLAQALRRFDSNLLVLPTKDANVIEITFRHRDAQLAADTVNTLLDSYAKRRKKLYDDPQLSAVRHETEALSRSVRDADAALASFKVKNGIFDYVAEHDLLLRRQSAARQALAESEVAASEQQARVATLGQQIHILPQKVSFFQEDDTDARLQTIDASLVDLHAQLAAARMHYRDTSRKVTDLVTKLRAREADRRDSLRLGMPTVRRAGRNPTLDNLTLDLAHAATEQAASVARAAGLRNELGDIEARLSRLAAQETSLADLQRRKSAADTAFANASQVLAEQEMTESEDRLRLANVRVIQAARPPIHAAAIPLLVIAAGILLGALTALLWCVTGIVIRPKVFTPEGLAQATALPVLCVLSSDTEQNQILIAG